MKINYVIPLMEADRFTGGILCLYEYIRGLSGRGHEVSVVPMIYEGTPRWIDLHARILQHSLLRGRVRLGWEAVQYLCKFHQWNKNHFLWLDQRHQSIRVANTIPECDINIATSFETALPVFLSSKGKGVYFMQHYEVLFAEDRKNPELARVDAAGSYLLPLTKIANSTWLANEMKQKYHEDVLVNPNAIDQKTFFVEKIKPNTDNIRIVSYGGGKREWKGFKDAARAVKIVRKKSQRKVEWIIYGDAIMEPDNEITPFQSVGFITGKTLADLYRSADLVLCPSWYESFPLYPLEAMACGVPIVTTPFGVEDYCQNEKNCLIVPPKDEQAMADAVLRLIQSPPLAQQLGAQAAKTGKLFTWKKAVDQLEQHLTLLLNHPS